MSAPPPVSDALAADHYRAFEAGGPEAAAFVAALEARTTARLAGPGRERAAAFLRRAMDHPVLGGHTRFPDPRGGEVAYLLHRGADDPQGRLARAPITDPYGAEPEPVIDPAAIDPSGTTSLHAWAIAPGGRHAAHILSEGGSDRTTLRVRDLGTGRDLPEVLGGIRFTNVAWAPDGAGFLYNRHLSAAEAAARFGEAARAGLHHRRFVVCRHRLGTPQDDDETVLDLADRPDLIAYPFRPGRDAEAEFVQVVRGTDEKNGLLWRPAGSDAPWREVQPVGRDRLSALAARRLEGRLVLLALTDRDAPRGRVVAVDLEGDVDPAAWRTVVPEGGRALMRALVGRDHLFAVHHTGTAEAMTRHALDGADPTPVEIPGGEQSLGAWRAHPDDAAVFVRAESRAVDGRVLRLDPEALALEEVSPPRSPAARPDAATLRLDVEVDDGARVPVSIVHAPGAPPGPDTPLVLTAYGGFGTVRVPVFQPGTAALLSMGCALAVAHIRGGGEFGRAWHEAARGRRRTRAFDDFAAVADHLVTGGLTSRGRLAIEGGSNGGLLVTAVMSRRPDLCAAVLAHVPVTDMLRYTAHHAGHAWIPEYGDPEDPDDRAVLAAYSPLHNLPRAPHPPILITTAENDDRVAPWHAHKLAAALVREGPSPDRVHLHVERAAGHGFGRSREQAVEGGAVRLAFLARTLGVAPPA